MVMFHVGSNKLKIGSNNILCVNMIMRCPMIASHQRTLIYNDKLPWHPSHVTITGGNFNLENEYILWCNNPPSVARNAI